MGVLMAQPLTIDAKHATTTNRGTHTYGDPVQREIYATIKGVVVVQNSPRVDYELSFTIDKNSDVSGDEVWVEYEGNRYKIVDVSDAGTSGRRKRIVRARRAG